MHGARVPTAKNRCQGRQSGNSMTRTTKGSSYFSGVVAFFRGKPQNIKSSTARKASARVQTRQSPGASADSHPYRAAEIVCEHNACPAAAELAGKRFLLREVPRIPLADCTSRNCACTYVRHKDRRSWSGNRRAEFSMRTKLFPTLGHDERRRRIGRRSDDKAALDGYDFSNWDI